MNSSNFKVSKARQIGDFAPAAADETLLNVVSALLKLHVQHPHLTGIAFQMNGLEFQDDSRAKAEGGENNMSEVSRQNGSDFPVAHQCRHSCQIDWGTRLRRSHMIHRRPRHNSDVLLVSL